jgi:hypothetical protein
MRNVMALTATSTATAILLVGSGVATFAQQVPTSIITYAASGSTVEVIDLKRTDDGSTLTLRGVFTNKTDKEIRLNVKDISLIDFKNKKKYLVISDRDLCVCSTPIPGPEVAFSGQLPVVKEGSSLRFWAKFAAPPESVTALSFVWGSVEPLTIRITN